MSSSSSGSGSGSDLYGGYGGVLGGGYTMSYYYSYDSSASGDGGGAIKGKLSGYMSPTESLGFSSFMDGDADISSSTGLALNVLDMDLPRRRLKRYKALFESYDGKHDNVLDRTELLQVMRAQGKNLSAVDIGAMVDVADQNGDGVITFIEFCAIMEQKSGIESRIVVEAFNTIDRGRKGHINTVDLQNILAKLGRNVDRDEAQALLGPKAGRFRRFTLSDFAGAIGFDGPLKVAAKAAADAKRDVNSTTTNTSSALSDSLEVARQDPDAFFRVEVRAFYLDERFLLHVQSTFKLGDLAELVAAKLDHPAPALRFYYRGYPMEKYDRTLAQYNVTVDGVLWFIFLPMGYRLARQFAFGDGELPHLSNIYKHFQRAGYLRTADALNIVRRATNIMKQEPNGLVVQDPVTVIGDLHGQFFDLEEIFSLGDEFSTKRTHVFIGDYVDRGYFSSEAVLFLLAAKICFPKNIILLRGNHECRRTTRKYGTESEFAFKYSKTLYDALMIAFDWMPLYAVLETAGKRVLLIHGGISPRLTHITELNDVVRDIEPRTSTVLYDVLWTDPAMDTYPGFQMPLAFDLRNLTKHSPVVPSEDDDDYQINTRGEHLTSYGINPLRRFLAKNDLLCVIRGHEQKPEGFQLSKYGPTYDFPACITIFSCPNYTDRSMNDGALLTVDAGRMEVRTFTYRLHPLYRDHKDQRHAHLRDLRREDFIQFLNWLYPETLYTMPVMRLEQIYRRGFVTRRAPADGSHDFSDDRRELRKSNPKVTASDVHALAQQAAADGGVDVHEADVSEGDSGSGSGSGSGYSADDYSGSVLAVDSSSNEPDEEQQARELAEAQAAVGAKTVEVSDGDDGIHNVDHWSYIRMNLMGILRFSNQHSTREIYHKKTRALLLWAQTHDFVTEQSRASESTHNNMLAELSDSETEASLSHSSQFGTATRRRRRRGASTAGDHKSTSCSCCP